MLNFLRSILKSRPQKLESKYSCYEDDIGDQADGDFHIDQCGCSDHGMCTSIASGNIKDTKLGKRVVFKQPSTKAELSAVIEAMEACPINCVHYSGSDTNILSQIEKSESFQPDTVCPKQRLK